MASDAKASLVRCVTREQLAYPLKAVPCFRDSKMPVFSHFNVSRTGVCYKLVHFTFDVSWGHVLWGYITLMRILFCSYCCSFLF